MNSRPLSADPESVSATTPHTVPTRFTVSRAALLLTAAGIVLAGCGRVTEPVASYRTAGSGAGIPTGVTVPPSDHPPAAAETSQALAAIPAHGVDAPAATTLAATAPLVAATALTPEELADIDRLLAGLDTHLAEAAHDAAIPEGDLE
jgi:hypothetical protein